MPLVCVFFGRPALRPYGGLCVLYPKPVFEGRPSKKTLCAAYAKNLFNVPVK